MHNKQVFVGLLLCNPLGGLWKGRDGWGRVLTVRDGNVDRDEGKGEELTCTLSVWGQPLAGLGVCRQS